MSSRSPAARVARRLDARGIHYGWVIAAVAFLTLITAAGFRSTVGVLIVPLQDEFGWSRGTLSLAELEAEITAQIARIHESRIRISHVDGHKHLHQLPLVRNAVARVLPRFGIERVRVTRLTRLAGAKPATLVREALAWQATRTFRRARLRSPARVVDLQAVMQPVQSADTSFTRWAPEGPIEVFCHPGTRQADIEKPGSCRRFDELTYLLSPRFQELLSANGARMVSYWDI